MDEALDMADAPHPWLAPLDVAAVYETHADFVWASLHRLGVPTADLPDLLQEVFVVVHRRRHDWDGSSRIRGWLFVISAQLVRNYRRTARHRRERLVAEPEEGLSGTGGDPDHALHVRLARHTAERLLGELEPEKRAILVMFEVEEMECGEIAAALGVPVGTVYSRLHAARKDLARVVTRFRAREGGLP